LFVCWHLKKNILQVSGSLRHEQVAGRIVETGDILGTIVLDDPTNVARAAPCDTGFPHPASVESLPDGNVFQRFKV
jgi:hypothetical protein